MKIAITDKATMANELNSMYIRKPMTLQQMRFFTLYLAKINPKNPGSKVVRFSVDDFASIMQVEVNETAIKENIVNLLEHTVWVKSQTYKDGITACHLFRKSELFKDEYGVLQVEFQCSEEIEPYIFELRSNFTSFEVWNTLRLRSVIQSRLYQLLKQFQTVGERVILLDDLKEQLGIDKKAYPDYPFFNRDVLKKCQKALAELTDIKFDYKPIGRPAKSIRFTIYKNNDYDKKLVFEELGIEALDDQSQLPGQESFNDPESMDNYVESFQAPDPMREKYEFWSGACENEFSIEQIRELSVLAGAHVDFAVGDEYDNKVYSYLRRKYVSLANRKIDKSRYGMMKFIVENDV